MNATRPTSIRSFVVSLITGLVSVALITGCTSQPNAAVVGEWATSSDGVLSIRLRAPQTAFEASKPFVIFADTRNDSKEVINVLPALEDDYRAIAGGFVIQGPLGLAKYSGPTLDQEFSGPLSPAWLQPHETRHEKIELRVEDFDRSQAVGDYTIAFKYRVFESDRERSLKAGLDGYWIGEVTSHPIHLQKISP